MALKCGSCGRAFPAGTGINKRLSRDGAAQPEPLAPDPADSQVSTSAPWPMESEDPYVGSVLNGQYRILRQVGVGGMGAVYLADEEGMRRQVAVKVLMPRPGDNREREQRFQREARAASKLAHPNIVTVYNFGRLKDGTLFLAMEYIEGASFATVLRHQRPLTPERTLALAIQIADAVAEAHSKGIVHRDLKPDNILVTERRGVEVAKILDFGIAKLMDPNEDSLQATRAGLVRGTPIYMSPEQARGDALDHRTDVYAFGVMLYYSLTGELPIRAETPFGYLHAHQTQKVVPLRKVRPELNLSPTLDSLVMRCLAKKVDARPSTMDGVLNVLRIEQAQIQGLTPDPAWGDLPPTRRTSGLLYPLIAFGAALAVAAAAAMVFVDRAPSQIEGLSGASASAPEGSLLNAPTPLRRVESSEPARPAWVDAVPPDDEAGLHFVGVSGVVTDFVEGRKLAEIDAAERAIDRMIAEVSSADLRRTVLAWGGEERTGMEDDAAKAKDAQLAGGLDDSATSLEERFRAVQALVVRGFEDATGIPLAGLSFRGAYWERYEGAEGRGRGLHLVWVHALLDRQIMSKAEAPFTAHVSLADLTVVEPFPSLAWRGGDIRGALILRVLEASPAEDAGLRPGDLVQFVGGERVRRLSDFELVLRQRLPALEKGVGTVTLTARRAGEADIMAELGFAKPAPKAPAAVPTKPKKPVGGGSIDE